MMRRWLAILLVPALLIVAGVVDSSTRGPRTAVPVTTMPTGVTGGAAKLAGLAMPTSTDEDVLGPVAAPPSALDSTWFCAGGSSNAGGDADVWVIIANGGDHAEPATLTLFTGDGHIAAITKKVPAHDVVSVQLATVLQAEAVAAKVEVTGGSISVTQSAGGPTGSTYQPCATGPSPAWYFPSGSTARGASEMLYLFNPFSDDATANVSLQTDAGLRQPPAFQGVVVKANSLQVLDVSSVENRRRQIAATVTVTSGRLVAADQQRFDGTGDAGPSGAPPKGLHVGPGVPRAVGAVIFPFAYKSPNYGETLFVYNPGSGDAEVTVSILLDDPEKNGTMPDQQLAVPGGSVATLALSSLQPLPAQVVHTIVVRSTNGVPVTADLWLENGSSSSESSLAISSGTPVLATSWFLQGLKLAQSVTYVEVFNPGTAPVTLHATLLAGKAAAPVAGLDGVVVPAGGRKRVELPEAGVGHAQVSILLRGDAPVAVAWDRTSSASLGSNLSVGVPLSSTISLLSGGG